MTDMSWYAVPVCRIGDHRVRWTVVISNGEHEAINTVSEWIDLDVHPDFHTMDFVSYNYATRWLGPASSDDIDAWEDGI